MANISLSKAEGKGVRAGGEGGGGGAGGWRKIDMIHKSKERQAACACPALVSSQKLHIADDETS